MAWSAMRRAVRAVGIGVVVPYKRLPAGVSIASSRMCPVASACVPLASLMVVAERPFSVASFFA